ncbi:hypothetical protein BZA77DRAFT_15536 [Pyronema omphalodes]|nr:hypothetical protein BZA77DRAFT_15536 [Pyronema omphalodes]
MAAKPQWTELRALQSQTEDLLRTYSSFSIDPAPEKTLSEEQTETQLKKLFADRESVIAAVSLKLDSASATAKLQNFRSTLAEHTREYRRLNDVIRQARKNSSILSSVRHDIDSYRSAAQLEEGREADYMLEERGHLDNTHNMTDRVLSQAYAINQDFAEQRARLQNINRRAMYAASQIPGINHIISRINTRKKRDSVIMGVFIAFCFLMFLYFR